MFSLGGLGYFLITGTRSFTRPDTVRTLAAVGAARFERPSDRNPKMSGALEELLTQCLSLEPQNRPQAARQFREQLETYLVSLSLDLRSFCLSAWLNNPSDFVMHSMLLIERGLAERAEGEIARGATATAWNALAHFSKLAPESAALKRLTEGLISTTKRRRGLLTPLRTVGAALGILFVGVSLFALRKRTSSEVPYRSQAEAPLSEVANHSVPKRTTTLPVLAAKTVDPSRLKNNVASRVVFDLPAGVGVFWNGKPVNLSRGLPPQRIGTHRLRLEKVGSQPIEKQIVIRNSEPTVIRAR